VIHYPAIYSEAILPEHRGNPLIEALPKKVPDEIIIERLSYYPERSPESLSLKSFEREEYLTRLNQLIQPLPQYLECFRMIESAVKDGYSSRNPLSPTTNFYLHYLCHSQPVITPNSGHFIPKGTGMTVVGMSGVGKSKMIERCLQLFPQVIEHSSYDGNKLSLSQLLWLKVECPHDASLRGLCHSILGDIDDALNKEPTKPALHIDTLLDQIERSVKSSFVGIIVIDEMQNLNIGKAGGADKLLSFLLNLINRCGIPILFCGNPQMTKLLTKKFRNARRAENGGYIEMENLDHGGVWKIFCEELWDLQWTTPSSPLTPALDIKLYERSAGVLDVAVRIYKKAQEIVIGSGDERITPEVIDEAYNITCCLTDSGLDLLRRNKDKSAKSRENIRNEYDDLALNDNFNYAEKCNNSQKRNPDTKEDPDGIEIKKHSIPGDLSRPQHPEFSEKLRELQHAVNLHSRIVDPDLYQRAYSEENPSKYLKSKGLVCTDLLNHFK
tara:strand:- start:845 stop:2338 length:1494 start_codon:yes stop_codon:yes gene_type:complete